jgi:hypothetical protein
MLWRDRPDDVVKHVVSRKQAPTALVQAWNADTQTTHLDSCTATFYPDLPRREKWPLRRKRGGVIRKHGCGAPDASPILQQEVCNVGTPAIQSLEERQSLPSEFGANGAKALFQCESVRHEHKLPCHMTRHRLCCACGAIIVMQEVNAAAHGCRGLHCLVVGPPRS